MTATDLQKAVFAAGGIAYAAQEPLTSCPWSTAAKGGLRLLWIRGWIRAEAAAGKAPPVHDDTDEPEA